MMQTLIAAGQQLAQALHAENEALAALDLSRAGQLAGAKIRASDTFAAACAAAAKLGARAAAGTAERRTAEHLAASLQALGAENRRLLERAIVLQSRVIETIAGAAMPRGGARPGTYGASGGLRPAPRQAPPPALALSACA